MTKGLPRSMKHARASVAPVMKMVIQLRALALAVAGASGVGFGTVPIGDFPEGNILFMGACSYLKFTTADADVQAAFDGDYSIGSAPTADNALSGAEVNIIASTALGAATLGVSPIVRAVNATQVMLDNTDGSLEVNLNLLIDDANISAAGDFTVDGYVEILYSVLGDD